MNPYAIAEIGQKIYDERYKADLEAHYLGRYAAINVETEQVSLGDTPEEALEKARAADPHGLLHLIRVGFPSVYSGSRMTPHATKGKDWLFGR